jgi:UDP-galactopyranose mutase
MYTEGTMRILVIGAGFSGAVAARQLAEGLACQVEVWDERDHLGGNCHTERDAETGVMVHRYGPHIFNTDNERVWDYVRRFGDFRPFTNRVKAVTTRGVFTLPINLLTINQFFGKTLSPLEAVEFVSSLGDKTITEPGNFEEQALKMLGRDLYEAFFEGYTIKQWGCHPRELPASILKRLPVRFNYDDNYYNRRFQGIPAEGYTEVIRRILDHPSIRVQLGKSFRASESSMMQANKPALLIYTGPIDAFFDYREGRLGYRTVTFERIRTGAHDYQGNAVVNYTDRSVPWTRIHEHKHFAPWEAHERTVAFREFSKETEAADVPYYPKRLAPDMSILQRYRDLAGASPVHANVGAPVSFLGRLATYRYMDMETVIGEALEFSDVALERLALRSPLPVFPNERP